MKDVPIQIEYRNRTEARLKSMLVQTVFNAHKAMQQLFSGIIECITYTLSIDQYYMDYVFVYPLA